VELPEIVTVPGFQARWTPNIGHNLIDEAYLQFNDLVVNKITNYHMDFLRGFMVCASKKAGYDCMIGNVAKLTNPYLTVDPDEFRVKQGTSLPRYPLNIPLPFWFTRNPSDAIIHAACPFNDIKLTIKFRPWQDLLIVDELLPAGTATGFSTRPIASPNWNTVLTTSTVRLQSCQVWAHYAVIPNGDREKVGEEADIDVMIEQIQTIPATSFAPATNDQRGIDLRFSNSIRAIFFAMRNTAWRSEWSNYSTHTTVGNSSSVNAASHVYGITFGNNNVSADDPIARAVLTYENVDRVNMFSDYYSMVAPYYTAVSIPDSIGYHVLPYCNRLDSNQPDGTTNFARLASVTLNLEASLAAIDCNTAAPVGSHLRSTFDIIITACSNTILRFSSGSAGFPVV
jgi:hypothetical protein